ncbi:MAG: exonuclease SbcCD subunit D [Desulfovibrionaceae bacterium]
MRYETVRASGLLFIADPHLADTPPGQRLPGYREQILHKVELCLARARELDLCPVLLGDLFHWPRDNSNQLLVALIDLLRPQRPFALVGNHDKYQARLTSDVSLAVLQAAGVLRLLDEPGPQFVLETPSGRALVGASPDGARLPARFDRDPDTPDTVLWLTHHNLRFPDFLEGTHRLREIPGVDLVVNGHIHRPQPTVTTGATTWVNPGNITRLTFSRHSLERIPAAHLWRPGMAQPERWDIPHLPFYEVFPDQPFPTDEAAPDAPSRFLQGLERLAWRRTHEGIGLKQFLQDNLNPDAPEHDLIWELYEEVTRDDRT